MKAVLNRSAGYLTPEQCVRNFFGLYRRDVLDANGNICDYDDDLREPPSLSKDSEMPGVLPIRERSVESISR